MTIKRIKLNMKSMMLSFAAFVVALSGVTAMNIANSESAAAAGPCKSDYVRVGTYNMTASGTKTGTLEIYWSNSAKRNCAIARCYSFTCGDGVHRQVHIKRTGDTTWNDYESGWGWSTYAGPVYSYPSAGRCISAYAHFYTKVSDNYGTANISGKHCG